MSGDVEEAQKRLAAELSQHPEKISAFVVLLTAVAEADGDIDGVEKEWVQTSLQSVFGSTLAPAIVRQLLGMGLEMLEERGERAALEASGEVLSDLGVIEDAVVVALELARVSKGVHPKEKETIRAVAKAAGMPVDALPAEIRD